jgi:N-acetylneuraminic acid mutarotase
VAVGLSAVITLAAPAGRWTTAKPLPTPRSEVAAAVVDGRIAIVGGFLLDGNSSAQVDLYWPDQRRWSRLPDLPVPVNHTMAASDGKRLYVMGGYGEGFRTKLHLAIVYERGLWRRLPQLPAARAAGGAAAVGGKVYVVGGVGETGLARQMLVFDRKRGRWSTAAGPTPREHLAVTVANGRIYALGGRTAGYDTNLTLLEVYDPASRRWRELPSVPIARGGTGAAAAAGMLVSVGGERPEGTIPSVFGFSFADQRWRPLPWLPTARHGLGVAAVGDRVFAIAGGTEPGLTVSAANEVLRLERETAPGQ